MFVEFCGAAMVTLVTTAVATAICRADTMSTKGYVSDEEVDALNPGVPTCGERAHLCIRTYNHGRLLLNGQTRVLGEISERLLTSEPQSPQFPQTSGILPHATGNEGRQVGNPTLTIVDRCAQWNGALTLGSVRQKFGTGEKWARGLETV